MGALICFAGEISNDPCNARGATETTEFGFTPCAPALIAHRSTRLPCLLNHPQLLSYLLLSELFVVPGKLRRARSTFLLR
jgi:hypothetical protein